MARLRNPWVRLYTKILTCADYMEAPYHVRVAWIAIICYASDMSDGGRLISGARPLDAARLARIANIGLGEAEESIAYLLDCGMLTRDSHDNVLVVANWDEYQKPSDNSSRRVAKHRENCNGDNAVTVTVQEEEEERDKEAERLATLLHNLIHSNMVEAGYKKVVQSEDDMYSHIEKIHRLDGIEYKTIEEVIRWCQDDEFWHMNILSGTKLRKQFPRLLMEMQKGTRITHAEIPRFV